MQDITSQFVNTNSKARNIRSVLTTDMNIKCPRRLGERNNRYFQSKPFKISYRLPQPKGYPALRRTFIANYRHNFSIKQPASLKDFCTRKQMQNGTPVCTGTSRPSRRDVQLREKN